MSIVHVIVTVFTIHVVLPSRVVSCLLSVIRWWLCIVCSVRICSSVWRCICMWSGIVRSVWIFPSVWGCVSGYPAALGSLTGKGASNTFGFTSVTRGLAITGKELTLGGCR